MIVGFGAKAGMMPMQSWLPAAHPVAPAPASAVLSGVITKGGVVAVIRVTYYMFGPEFLAGSWPPICAADADAGHGVRGGPCWPIGKSS